MKNALEPRRDEAADGNDHHMDGFNGFLASRPAEIVEYSPAPVVYDFEMEMMGFTSNDGHMAL